MGELVNEIFGLAPISTELLRHDMLCLSDPGYIWFSAVNVISNHAGLVHCYPKNQGLSGHEIALSRRDHFVTGGYITEPAVKTRALERCLQPWGISATPPQTRGNEHVLQ